MLPPEETCPEAAVTPFAETFHLRAHQFTRFRAKFAHSVGYTVNEDDSSHLPRLGAWRRPPANGFEMGSSPTGCIANKGLMGSFRQLS
jgi:hypothetical protein